MAAKPTSTEDLDALRAKVKELEARLATQATENEDAVRRAMFFRQRNDEIPTGRKVDVAVCTGYETTGYRDDGTAVKKPKWENRQEPTFFYTVDMPPVGGVDIKVNGMQLYHGETYELTLDQVRMVKDMVYRLERHDAEIHGTDENAYRPKSKATFSGKSGGRVH